MFTQGLGHATTQMLSVATGTTPLAVGIPSSPWIVGAVANPYTVSAGSTGRPQATPLLGTSWLKLDGSVGLALAMRAEVAGAFLYGRSLSPDALAALASGRLAASGTLPPLAGASTFGLRFSGQRLSGNDVFPGSPGAIAELPQMPMLAAVPAADGSPFGVSLDLTADRVGGARAGHVMVLLEHV